MSKPLHEQIEADATALADAIETGEYDALDVDQRMHLRALTMRMMEWAEWAELAQQVILANAPEGGTR